ncbi:MAG: YihY/virulence factor BrkB family protein [Bacteroidales bacterium]
MKRKIKPLLKDLWEVIKNTAIRWDEANPWRQSAIIAYYSIFSLPALLLIIIVMTGFFYGEAAVSNQLSEQIEDLVGKDAANAVETMVANAAETGSSRIAFIAGIGFLIFGATTVFYQLQLSLNRIWGVVSKPQKAFLKYLKDRLFSFGLIIAIGFLMLLSLIVNSLLSMLGDWLKTQWPDIISSVMNFSNYIISLVVITVMFALMFKILPDAIIRWRSVWVGAFLTALLFGLGQFGLSMYFSYSDPGSVYGAAGSVILLLVWISYVAMILLFGAEFTRQWALKFGHGIKPKESAELIDTDDNPFLGTE